MLFLGLLLSLIFGAFAHEVVGVVLDSLINTSSKIGLGLVSLHLMGRLQTNIKNLFLVLRHVGDAFAATLELLVEISGLLID